MNPYLIAALYKFVELPDYQALRSSILACCNANGIKGTLLLAPEGINGTVAGKPDSVHALLRFLRQDARLASLEHKESWADSPPFVRLKVRLKKEIVTLGVEGVNPSRMAGTYVKPQDWNALISRDDVIVIDTRNDYEVEIGSFKNAIDPKVKAFSDLPEWIAHEQAPGGRLQNAGTAKPKVAMFCTGGIRCEKSTAFMRMQGFDEVYHLEGGILKYLEQVPPQESLWQGECFVFDERVSVGHGLVQGAYTLCRACGHPLSEQDQTLPSYVKGVSCHHCIHQTSPQRKQQFAERQRQVALAKAKGERHIGKPKDAQNAAPAGPGPVLKSKVPG